MADIAIQDYLEITNLAFAWAASYDAKDWSALHACLAPKIRLDFRSLQGELHEQISPDEYVAILVGMIGDKHLKTQHLIGGSKWKRQGEVIHVTHQLRVAHQRYDENGEAVNHGHGHGYATHWYRRVDGVWKIEGVAPELLWSEYDIFGTLKPSTQEASQ